MAMLIPHRGSGVCYPQSGQCSSGGHDGVSVHYVTEEIVLALEVRTHLFL